LTIDTTGVAHLLAALAALLVAAHLLGAIFARFRQPRVIGEIAAGLLLGPTLLGHLAPRAESWLFPASGVTPTVLGAVYQLGLLLLLFCSGAQIRSGQRRSENKTVGWVFTTGTILPFLAGLGLLHVLDLRSSWGPHANAASFLLIFAIAMAVTSIPVISKIMHDLGILDTPFARVVLGVAVAEDIVLYVILAVSLGLAQTGTGGLFGLPPLLGIGPGTAADMAYHVVATLAVLGAALTFGPRIYRAAAAWRLNLIRQASPVAYDLALMLAATLLCLFLGIEGFFGAFVAGVAVGRATQAPAMQAPNTQTTPATQAAPATQTAPGVAVTPDAIRSIQGFAFAFFIPIYFAVVGLQLDLLRGFNVGFFLLFLLLACVVKAGSVFLGARLGGQTSASSWNLAVALNARGGPGIVVASVAYGAGIIDQPFYAVLVMLAIVTSLFAGSWLAHVPRDRLLAEEGSPAWRRPWRAGRGPAPEPTDP
jgi:Kef-type K+ transport system membrane component KefB